MRIKIFITLLLFLAMAGIAEEWMTFTTDDGLAHNECRCIAVDHDGVVWVGHGDVFSGVGGVSSWDGETWTTYHSWTTDFALRSDYINDIAVDENNNKWFATGIIPFGGAGLTKYDGDTWTYFDLDTMTELEVNLVTCIEEDSEGNLWVGGASFLAKYDHSSWYFFYPPDFGISRQVTTIYFDNFNIGHVGSQRGFATFEFGSFFYADILEYSIINDFNLFLDMFVICYDGGLYLNYEGSIHYFNIDSGLVNNYSRVCCIEDTNKIWIGTSGGLSLYNGSDWTDHRTNPSFPTSGIHDIIIDGNKNIYFASFDCLYVFNEEEIVWSLSENQIKTEGQLKVYPNPFNSVCYIENSDNEGIIIYDCYGNNIKSTAENQILWSPNNLASGIYIISNKTYNISQKVTYIK